MDFFFFYLLLELSAFHLLRTDESRIFCELLPTIMDLRLYKHVVNISLALCYIIYTPTILDLYFSALFHCNLKNKALMFFIFDIFNDKFHLSCFIYNIYLFILFLMSIMHENIVIHISRYHEWVVFQYA